MKKIIVIFTFTCLITGLNSCDKNFESVNVNPVLPTTLDPAYLFSNSEVTSAVSTLSYQLSSVQQIVSPYTGVLEGGNHNIVYDPNSNALFNNMYGNPVKLLTDVIRQTKSSATRSNLYHMSRILRAYVFEVLVDTYGDVPYLEAGNAYLQSIYLPKYDDQKTIYPDLLKEVTEAVKALDPSKPTESGDLFYRGNIAQWKRLGNSLLLRIAMRYTKVDQAKAKQYVAIATDPANGGVMQSNADNAFIQFNSTFNNPNANSFQGTERANYYLAKPLVDYMQSTSDPRLSVIAVKYAAPANPLATAGAADNDPTHQNGIPMGYNENTISSAPGFPGKAGAAYKYSQINRQTLGKIDAPEFFITYAQTQLLLAEAAFRGWVNGNASDYYNAGVRAHMNQMTQFDASAAVPSASQDAYLAANPYTAGTELQQINTQYWIASFLNGSEAWANFRRSGYPVLQPNPYPSSDPSVKGDFIHRLPYPVREQSVNSANYGVARDRIGGDNLASRIFWDK